MFCYKLPPKSRRLSTTRGTLVVSMVELSTICSGTKRHRQSEHIQIRPLRNLYHAPRMAEAIGAPLNVHVTINFDHTSCALREASAVFEKIRNNHFGPWIKRPPRRLQRDSDPSAYAWVLENPGTLNAHWIVHLPADRVAGFKARVEGWLRSSGIEIKNDFAVRVDHITSPIGLSYYLMKGANPAYAEFYGIKRVESQGPIIGKRSGVSRSLAPKRRAALREAGLYRKAWRRAL